MKDFLKLHKSIVNKAEQRRSEEEEEELLVCDYDIWRFVTNTTVMTVELVCWANLKRETAEMMHQQLIGLIAIQKLALIISLWN